MKGLQYQVANIWGFEHFSLLQGLIPLVIGT